MEAVLSLLEDLVGVGLKDLGGDLLPPVGGQAVLHHGAGVGQGHELGIDLIDPLEGQAALLGLLLLAHGGPHVGDDHIGPGHGLLGVPAQGELGIGDGLGEVQHLRIGVIALGAGHGHVHAALQTAHDEGVGHIVAVADEAQLQALQPGHLLPDGHQVGQHLAGVGEVGEAVDDGDGGVFGQLLHLVLAIGADHDAVTVAAEHPGGIGDGLAPADLALLAGEEESVTAHLIGPHLKGHTGPGGIFLKNHGQGLAFQAVVGQAVLLVVLHLVGHVQDLGNVLPGQVQQLEQVFLHLQSPHPNFSRLFFLTKGSAS